MNKKSSKEKPNNLIEIGKTVIPKKITPSKQDPFARLKLHPLEELEARDSDSFGEGTTNQTGSTNNINTTTKTGTTNKIGTTTSKGSTSEVNTTNKTGSTKKISTTSLSGSTYPISPERDYSKTPNSIIRIAVAQGLFKGKSKQIYDYLWSVSRAAINPSRTVNKSFPQIIKGSGLSKNTVFSGISHLENVGLIKREKRVGNAEGNIYEIFTPEELGLDIFNSTNSLNTTNTTGPIETYQKLVVPVVPETGTTNITQVVSNSDNYEQPKTLFKTNTNDDDNAAASEAFSVMNERLNTAVKKLTGKATSKREAEKWGTLADLLILELEVAASRAGNISSVPAFLTEVLRRQFFASRRQEHAGKSTKAKPDTVGKSDYSGPYEIKQLDAKGREVALEQLREFAGSDFLDDFKKWYTPEDWNWLTEQLKKSE